MSSGYSKRAELPLTPAMLDGLRAIADGQRVAEIALRRGVSEHTIRTELRAACGRLGARNLTAAACSLVRAEGLG